MTTPNNQPGSDRAPAGWNKGYGTPPPTHPATGDAKPVEQRQELQTDTRYTRFEDLSPNGTLTIIVQSDGDVIVALYGRGISGDMRMASVEFCFPGSGGGQSSRTRTALQAVAEAIAKDNAEQPQNRK